jgi:lipase ATG15
MFRKRLWCGLTVHGFLLTALLSSLVSADHGLQVPLIPPQVPLNGPEATLNTHEFVRPLYPTYHIA